MISFFRSYRSAQDIQFIPARIQSLRSDGTKIIGKVASGFVRRENNGNFLYTCWHVVADFDPNDTAVPLRPREVNKISVTIVDTKAFGELERADDEYRIEVVLPLYDETSKPPLPLWFQEAEDKPHLDLNSINIRCPRNRDLVKLKLPLTTRPIPEKQTITAKDFYTELPKIGDRVLVAGFPYGYSSFKKDIPTAVLITRHIATSFSRVILNEFLLDGGAAPGMSGSPVFIERRPGKYLLVGMYTGVIFPNPEYSPTRLVTAIGTCAILANCFGDAQLVPCRPCNVV